MNNFSFLALSIVIVVFSSCNSTPDNLRVIPKQTEVVLSVNISSLVLKSGIGTGDVGSDLFNITKREIRRDNKEMARLLTDLKKSPMSTGVNYFEDIFVFYYNESYDEQFICISIELKDSEKFGSFIDDFCDANDSDYELEEEENYQCIFLNDLCFAWDEDKAVLIEAADYNDRSNLDYVVEHIFNLDKDDDITNNEQFSKFYKNHTDLGLWVNSDIILSLSDHEISQFEDETGYEVDEFMDSHMSVFLTFEAGQINLKTSIEYNDKLKEKMDEIYFTDGNKSVSKALPMSSFLFGSASLNPVYFEELVSEQMKQSGNQHDDDDGSYSEEEIFMRFLGHIGGSISYSIFDFKDIEYSYMDWGYGFDETEAERLEELHEISNAGYLSNSDKEKLNNGEAIKSDSYSGRYCISIQNILDDGEDVEFAIANDLPVIWYEDCWTYGKHITQIDTTLQPMMGLSFDIVDSETFKDYLDYHFVDENLLVPKGKYFTFLFDDAYPSYLSIKDGVCLITNDKECVIDFSNDGHSKSLVDNKNYSNESSSFAHANLNYPEYPKRLVKEFRNVLNDEQPGHKKIVNNLDELVKDISFISTDNSNFEITLNFNDDSENSLLELLSFIEDNFDEIKDLD